MSDVQRAMKTLRTSSGALILLVVLGCFAVFGAETVSQLQTRFEAENNSVRKAKIFEKLSDAQFFAIRSAERAGDHNTVGLTFEKYRDNLRVSVDALKKQHPDAEKQSNGYKQVEVTVRKGIREIDESILVAPPEYLPPLKLVRQDLVITDNELLHLLFPRRPGEQPRPLPTSDPPPASDTQP
ncbi:MAG TPA: hypothetical protein VK525_09520 [Candidatus Saccharimonadales bacterium]|jgi:hypothetical protein|nr:hypothetical protein [Candidatus Saccharimonadales bacterium]